MVFQEMKMVDDTPDDLVHDLFAEKAWPGHPLGRPILGRREVVHVFERLVAEPRDVEAHLVALQQLVVREAMEELAFLPLLPRSRPVRTACA